MEGGFKQCEVKIVAQLPWQRRALGGQSPWLLTLPRSPGPLLKTISLPISSCHFHIHRSPPSPVPHSSFSARYGSHFNTVDIVFSTTTTPHVCLWLYRQQVDAKVARVHIHSFTNAQTQAQTNMKETEVTYCVFLGAGSVTLHTVMYECSLQKGGHIQRKTQQWDVEF